MRTTLDIPDQLITKAKKIAAERNTTLRSIVIKALDREIHNESNQANYIPKMITAGSIGDKIVSAEEINSAISENNDFRTKSW